MEIKNQSRKPLPKAFVSSVIPLTNQEKILVNTAIKSSFGINCVIENRIEPDLLGGLKIKVGFNIIDLSLQSQLNELKNLLMSETL